MLALRLTLTARPLALLLRLLLLCASAGVGLLLLATLSYALDHPARTADSAVRLLWCAVPLGVAAQLSVALSRTEPHHGARSGLVSAGVGPARLRLLAAVAAALPCVLGSVLVLLCAVALGDTSGLASPGTGTELPLPGQPLPVPATLTLLSGAPVVAATAAALAAARDTRDQAEERTHGDPHEKGPRAGATLASCAALTAGGLALASYAAHGLPREGERPVRADTLGVSALPVGWLLAALGLVLAGPGLTHLSGRLLAAGHPGPVRLLSGRSLQREAPFVGRPLGALCAVAAALLAFARVRGTSGAAPLPGPLVTVAVALVVSGAVGAGLAALARARHMRQPAQEVLVRLGASRKLRRATALARAGALSGALAVPVWVAGHLAALPLA